MAGRTAIGLDIGSSALRAAELSSGGGRVTLERLGQVLVPEGAVRDGEVVDGPAVTLALQELWRTHRFTSKRVHMGVANQRVIVREVDLPDMPLGDVAAALPFQVQDVLPIPVETAILDFHPLERRTDATGAPVLRGLLVAASREMVTANVAAVQAAGLTVVSVDLNSFAVLRAVGKRLDVETDTEALIDIGARVTNIVVHSAGVPRFVRILLSGGDHVTDSLSERLGLPVDEAEALKQELSLGLVHDDPRAEQALLEETQHFIDDVRGSLDYFTTSQPGSAPQRIVLTGGGAQLRGLAERLSTATRLPVTTGDATGRFVAGRAAPRGDALAAVAPLAAVPVGLALGAGL